MFERCCHASSFLMARWPTTLLHRSRRRPPPPKNEKKIASHTHRFAHEISWQIHSICTYANHPRQPPPPPKKNTKRRKRGLDWGLQLWELMASIFFCFPSVVHERCLLQWLQSHFSLYFTFFLSINMIMIMIKNKLNFDWSYGNLKSWKEKEDTTGTLNSSFTYMLFLTAPPKKIIIIIKIHSNIFQLIW